MTKKGTPLPGSITDRTKVRAPVKGERASPEDCPELFIQSGLCAGEMPGVGQLVHVCLRRFPFGGRGPGGGSQPLDDQLCPRGPYEAGSRAAGNGPECPAFCGNLYLFCFRKDVRCGILKGTGEPGGDHRDRLPGRKPGKPDQCQPRPHGDFRSGDRGRMAEALCDLYRAGGQYLGPRLVRPQRCQRDGLV